MEIVLLSLRRDMADVNRTDIARMTDDELDKFIESGTSVRHAEWGFAVEERQRRQLARLAKLHPIIWWTFVVATLSLFVCVIGYWDQIVRLFR